MRKDGYHDQADQGSAEYEASWSEHDIGGWEWSGLRLGHTGECRAIDRDPRSPRYGFFKEAPARPVEEK